MQKAIILLNIRTTSILLLKAHMNRIKLLVYMKKEKRKMIQLENRARNPNKLGMKDVSSTARGPPA